LPCYWPITVHKDGLNESGKARIVFNKKAAKTEPDAFQLPCGKCLGCALEKARQWSIRIVHEAKMWPQACFITLTYRDECLPKHGSISPYDFQCFMKRLRKKLKKKSVTFTVVNTVKDSAALTIMPLFLAMIFQTVSCGNPNHSPASRPQSSQDYGPTASQRWAISRRNQPHMWQDTLSKRSTVRKPPIIIVESIKST